ncbi:MAG TPA: adenylate/guanylate cyclase domain-containing protein, partial [Chloroflexi bacterium]|nr:adenylate/guanylate cyclase domain-containing protein [Chloroflexota bacterium]
MRCARCGFENPPGTVFCGQCGASLSPSYSERVFVSGERRLVTVLFAYVQGLLTLSEHLDPEETFPLISACVEALSTPVYQYGGTVDKFIGQELMAVFGAPEVHEDDAARALWAALEMIEALEQFNQAHQAALPEPLAIRCGVNTGVVFAGDVGAPGLRAFTVIGDAVNLASRLAHVAEPGQVFAGETTYRQTQRLFYFRPLPPLSVRGRLEAVSVYALTGAREGYRRAWGISGLSSPLVGRQREMAALRDHLRWLLVGQGGIVSVVGEAGLGKSRLVAESRAAVQEPRWLEGRSLSFQVEQPYFPFRDLIQRYLDLDEAVSPAEARDRLEEMVSRFVPEQVDEVYPFLGYLLGVLPDKRSAGKLEPLSGEGLRRGLFNAVRALLKGMAEDRPTVVVMEDLHWADETSLNLLIHLMPLAQEAPVLFLSILRPEPRSGPLQRVREGGMGVGLYSEVRLSPLSPEESATLIANLLRTNQIPRALQERILEKAEGNPLFVEEIVRSLIQDGVLVEEGGRWEVTREVQVIHIPDTLRGLLVSRVDGLEPEVRQTLRQAAVIGRVFPERILAAVSGNGKELARHLRVLLDRNFIRYYRLEGEQGKAYIFNHALTHEATYEGILKDERRLLHRRTL